MTWKVPANMSESRIEKELKRLEVSFKEQCRNGAVASTKLRFADFCPQYLDIMKARLSPLTLQEYTAKIDRIIIPILGHLKLSEIKPAHVQDFIQKISELPNKNGNGKLSPATVQRYLVTLNSIFSLAVKLGYISESPAKSEKLVIPKAVAPRIEIFTKQEAAAMLACLEQEDLQFQVFVQLAIHSGGRRGEIVSLKFSDINFETAKITIERSAYKPKGQKTQIKPPKDYEIRDVAVNRSCLELIKLLQAEKKKQAERLGSKWEEGEWLFTQWNGEIMNPHTPTKKFADFLRRHNLPHKELKALRHTSATLLLYGGANVKQVQSRLGHGKIETTNKYLHYIEEADVEAANILDRILNPSSIKIVKKAEQA
jgi:integrase